MTPRTPDPGPPSERLRARRPGPAAVPAGWIRWYAEAARSADEAERLMAHADTWLAFLGRASSVLVTPVDRQLDLFTSPPIVAWADPATRFDALAYCAAYVRAGADLDPVASRRVGATRVIVVGTAEACDPDAWARFRAEQLEPFGMESAAAVHLRDAGRIVATAVVLREAGRPDFCRCDIDGCDIDELCRAHGLLEQGYRLARRSASNGVDPGAGRPCRAGRRRGDVRTRYDSGPRG